MIAPRRSMSFSLRTLFVIVTAAGCWLGWQIHIIRERDQMETWLYEHGWMRMDYVNTPHAHVPMIRLWLGDIPRDAFAQGFLDAAEVEELGPAKDVFPEAKSVTEIAF